MSNSEYFEIAAEHIEEIAASWIRRRYFSDWNAQGQADLDAWLNESPAHEVAYLRLEAAWERTERLAALRRPFAEKTVSKFNVRPVLFRMAAAFAFFAILGAGAAYVWQAPRDRTYSTPIGGHETVAFTDGSRIELNTNTVIRTRMTTKNRMVWLDKGEAYFQVKHDPAHPFIVMAGTHRITDLGTKFLVKRDPDHLEVALVDGSVRIGDARGQLHSALLAPGDDAIATAESIFVSREPAQQLSYKLSWRQGVLMFSRTALSDVANEFNRYNRKQIVIADKMLAARKIGGTFPATDVDAFTKTVQIAFGVRIEEHGNEIVISR